MENYSDVTRAALQESLRCATLAELAVWHAYYTRRGGPGLALVVAEQQARATASGLSLLLPRSSVAMSFPAYSPRFPASAYTLLSDLARSLNHRAILSLARSLPGSWLPAAEKAQWAALSDELEACLVQVRQLNTVRRQRTHLYQELIAESLNARAAGLDAPTCRLAYIQPALAQESLPDEADELLRAVLAHWGTITARYLALLAQSAPPATATGTNPIDGQPLTLRAPA